MPHKTVRKTVFISYRHEDGWIAWAVYSWLVGHGYTVFMDHQGLNSGAFDANLLRQIAEHDHFVLLLTPDALKRCIEPGDWVRREIERALETKRNIVPLLFNDFEWSKAIPYLTGPLSVLHLYNSLPVRKESLPLAMGTLMERFLNISLDDVAHPPLLQDTQPIPEVVLTADQYLGLAQKHTQAGQYDKAIQAASHAIALDKQYADAYLVRSEAYEGKAQYKQAIADMNEVIALYPKDDMLYIRRSRLYLKSRNLGQALADATQAIRLSPRNADAFRLRAEIYEKLGNYGEADADIAHVMRLMNAPQGKR